MKMHFLSATATAMVIISSFTNVSAQNIGETTFKQVCAACHTIGKGRLVGPDLSGIEERRPQEWIIKFVKSSQSVINSEDEYANALFQEYNNVPMPDNPNLTDEHIKDVLAYIKENSSASAITKTDAANVPGDRQRGQDLFVGNIRFTNNGPTCNSCHNVNMQGLISGGLLAKDLTQSVSRLTAKGVKGIITGMPFPQMKQSYETKPLTEQEIVDITAFLNHANELALTTQPKTNIGNKMLIGGVGGVMVLLILFSFFWIKRKQRTVNYSIYKRQIKST